METKQKRTIQDFYEAKRAKAEKPEAVKVKANNSKSKKK